MAGDLPKESPQHCDFFGSDPYYYYYYCCYAYTEPNQVGCDMQYLTYKQGDPSPAARRALAEAVLRQWCAEGAWWLSLARVQPCYLAEDSPVLLGRDAVRFERLPISE